MAVENTTDFSGPYTANGVTVTFPFSFISMSDAEIAVLTVVDDEETIVSTDDYTVSRNGDGTGSVTFGEAPDECYVYVISDVSFSQSIAFENGVPWKAEPVNEANDRAAARDIYLKSRISRGVLVPRGEDGLSLPSAEERASKYPVFNPDGSVGVSSGTGADAGLREDLAATSGAGLIGALSGNTVQEELSDFENRISSLETGPYCDIVPIIGQSLTVGRANAITTTPNPILYMPVGGPEWPSVNNPAPLSPSSRVVVSTNFSSFVPYVGISGKENSLPGMAYQAALHDVPRMIGFIPGQGGISLKQLRQGNVYFANLELFLFEACKAARAAGFTPRIIPFFNQGHSDTDTSTDGGTGPISETTSAQYVAGLRQFKNALNRACSNALGEPWNDTLWVTPLLTGGATGPSYTLTGRKQVAAGQLAASASIPGIKLLPPFSQFALNFDEGDLVHPNGQAFRYYGELAMAYAKLGTLTPPRIVSWTSLSSTQTKVTFDQAVVIDGTLAEASTSGVKYGLEVYTSSPSQLAASGATASGRDVTITHASGTVAKVRNGLAQETTGAATKMPRTHVRGTTAVGTAEDGTTLYNFSIPQEA